MNFERRGRKTYSYILHFRTFTTPTHNSNGKEREKEKKVIKVRACH